MKNKKIPLIISISSFVLFLVLIVLLKTVDVQNIGANNTAIGLATINKSVLNFFGNNEVWSKITDYLLILAIFEAGCFALLGLVQWIKRKSLKKVDASIYLLACGYIFVICFYILFRFISINYRPILIDGELELSFPSSHTFAAITIFSLGLIEGLPKIKNAWLKSIFLVLTCFIISFTVFGRLVSGVHWLTDIVGSVFLCTFTVSSFLFFKEKINKTEKS